MNDNLTLNLVVKCNVLYLFMSGESEFEKRVSLCQVQSTNSGRAQVNIFLMSLLFRHNFFNDYLAFK